MDSARVAERPDPRTCQSSTAWRSATSSRFTRRWSPAKKWRRLPRRAWRPPIARSRRAESARAALAIRAASRKAARQEGRLDSKGAGRRTAAGRRHCGSASRGRGRRSRASASSRPLGHGGMVIFGEPSCCNCESAWVISSVSNTATAATSQVADRHRHCDGSGVDASEPAGDRNRRRLDLPQRLTRGHDGRTSSYARYARM
jgi:hypothetical protein